MAETSLICIGGPLAGQRNSASEEPTDYRHIFLRKGAKEFDFFLYKNLTVSGSFREIFEAHKDFWRTQNGH